MSERKTKRLDHNRILAGGEKQNMSGVNIEARDQTGKQERERQNM